MDESMKDIDLTLELNMDGKGQEEPDGDNQ